MAWKRDHLQAYVKPSLPLGSKKTSESTKKGFGKSEELT